MEETVLYNNTDITDEVSPNAVTYDMRCGCEMADTLEIIFDDDSSRWSKWNVKIDDVVEYKNGEISTGKMFVADKGVANDQYHIFCTSFPSKAKVTQSKAWENVYLEQVFNEVCSRFGFKFVRKCKNRYYKYIVQQNKSNIRFLAEIAKLEGCCLIARDGTIYLYSEEDLEKEEQSAEFETEDGRFEMGEERNLYGSCLVLSGKYKGKYTRDKNLPQLTVTVRSNSDAESYRFAKNILRNRNKNLVTSYKLQIDLEKNLTAGIVAELKANGEIWNDKKVFAYRVRHEYHSEKTTIFMRERIDGY